MAARTVTALDGDTLDLIAWRACGRVAGAVEAVIEANPHALAPTALPAGLAIRLPDLAPAADAAPALPALWD